MARLDLERQVVPMLFNQPVGPMVWNPPAGRWHAGNSDADRKTPEASRQTTFNIPIADEQGACACANPVRPITAKHGASVAQVALSCLLHQVRVTSVIIVVKTTDPLHENVGATRLGLDADELATIEAPNALTTGCRVWMIARQGQAWATTPNRPSKMFAALSDQTRHRSR